MSLYAVYRSPELLESVDKYLKEPVSAKSEALGKDIVEMIAEHTFAIPLWGLIDAGIMQPYTHDTNYRNKFRLYNFVGMWME